MKLSGFHASRLSNDLPGRVRPRRAAEGGRGGCVTRLVRLFWIACILWSAVLILWVCWVDLALRFNW